jgi:Ca2+-binding RTX toxin-like protein
MKGRVICACAIVCGLFAALLVPGVASAAIGIRDQAYPAGTSGAPTQSKPESKLWWNDGFWWAVMFRSGEYHIFRLNLRTQTWADTGVVVDSRDSTRQDVLSTGSKLFIASHKFVPVTSDTVPGANDEMRLLRFSYNAATNRYASSPDGVSVIDLEKSETLVIDRDSTGTLWATWVQADGSGHHVYVKSTTGNCVSGAIGNCNWGGATVLDDVGPDDISSVIRFGGNVGVMWSNSPAGEIRFSVHPWSSTEVVVGSSTNPKLTDDHINLKADSAGRVYAVTKTKFRGQTKPGTMLHRRSAAGAWATETVSRASLGRTRPIVILDPSHNKIRVFEAGGGAIYMKTSRMNVISFPQLSRGSTVIADNGRTVNDPTSTKQNVSNTTRLIVLATSHATKRYWHTYVQIIPCIRGTAGRNRLVGTRGNDRLCGLGGNDILKGLAGNDRLVGGRGRDTFYSRDRFRDVLLGGPGRDRARVDARDVRRSIAVIF